MRARGFFFLCLAGAGCGGAPPPPLAVVKVPVVRIEAVDEEKDEWLHQHCTYRGTAVVGSDAQAAISAKAHEANFVEPLFRSTSSSSSSLNGVTTAASFSAAHHVVLFACTGQIPW
jgi:hypothetical protein